MPSLSRARSTIWQNAGCRTKACPHLRESEGDAALRLGQENETIATIALGSDNANISGSLPWPSRSAKSSSRSKITKSIWRPPLAKIHRTFRVHRSNAGGRSFSHPPMRQSAEIVAASTASALQAKYTPCSFACWDKDRSKRSGHKLPRRQRRPINRRKRLRGSPETLSCVFVTLHPSVGPLPPGSLLSLYCPHIREGIATAPSNQHSIETFAIATGVIGDDVNSILPPLRKRRHSAGRQFPDRMVGKRGPGDFSRMDDMLGEAPFFVLGLARHR